MEIVRKYKLYKLGISQDANLVEFFEFVEFKISNLQKFKISKTPKRDYYMNSSGECIIEDNKINDYVGLKYKDLYSVLGDKFDKIPEETRDELIKFVIEKKYQIIPKVLLYIKYSLLDEVEWQFKKKSKQK